MTQNPSAVPGPPTGSPEQTGDTVIDSALSDLAGTDPEDLDAVIDAGEQLHRTLQVRLSDLGGD